VADTAGRMERLVSELSIDAPSWRWALRSAAHVLLAEAGERARRRAVPRSPADAGPRWLTAALCAPVPGARVTAVRRARGTAGTTTRAALELAYNEAGTAAGLPRNVFVKCTSALAQRLMLGLGGLIEGEPGFYGDVRARLDVPAPEGYFAALDRRSWRSIVVIEDVLATRGASFWTPAASITRAQAEELLASAAAWHGALWESPLLARWRWLRTPAEQMRVIEALIGLANRIPAGVERAGQVIPPAVAARQRELLEAMGRSLRRASAGPHTFLHGDLHVANTYATADGRIGVCDWQVAMRGCWCHDVAYLIATALAVEDRRRWERELLEHYLQRLGAAGGARIPFADAWDAYRRSLLYPYFAWLYTLGRSRLQPAFQPPAVSLMLVERIATAIDDLESFAAVSS
jgi:hypothetical protein